MSNALGLSSLPVLRVSTAVKCSEGTPAGRNDEVSGGFARHQRQQESGPERRGRFKSSGRPAGRHPPLR